MKLVVLGAAGQLAADVVETLVGDDVVPLTRSDLDICDRVSVDRVLRELRPDVVVNCSAYNLVDQAESEPEAAFAVNAFGARNVAQVCEAIHATFVHFSTDYVFGLDFTRNQPWTETDCPGPISVYGASKLAGEYFVQSECRKHFVVRTCGLYGRRGARGKGGNFVETMLRLAANGKPLRVVADQFCTPSYTRDVAQSAMQLLKTEAFGLYHITNAGGCSWHELASEIFRQSNLKVECQPIRSSEWQCPARRPAYSVLSNAKIDGVVSASRSSWRDALQRYLAARGSFC